MQSHERCSVVEVMGRNAGHLALYVGLATGATAVLVPEKPVDFDRDVIDRIRQARLAGNTHFMIIVAEGAGSAIEIGKGIHEELGLDPRVTILGHIQRGGTPSARDRVMASRMGYHAVKTLADGNVIKTTEMLALNIVNSNTSNSKGPGQAKAVVFFVLVAIISIAQLVATRKKEVDQ